MKKHKIDLGKALIINKNPRIYGSFAEIGAGQETVNHFFKAGLASQTVAKSMSAYDMTFSDEIYGKQNSYVCKERLITMLNHEYKLLETRLKARQGSKTCFFAFANTSTTSSSKKSRGNPHSWVGIRFQDRALGPTNNVLLHVDFLNRSRLQQYEALGVLGVNLIYACLYLRKDLEKFIPSLYDHIKSSVIEINDISFSGKGVKHLNASEAMSLLCLKHKAYPS